MPMKKHEFDRKRTKWLREKQILMGRIVRFLRENAETVYSGEELEKQFGKFLRFEYGALLKDAIVVRMEGMSYFYSPPPDLNPRLSVDTWVEHDYCTYEHGSDRCTVLGKSGVITRIVEPDLDADVFEHRYEVDFDNTILTLKSNNLRIMTESEREGGSR